MDHCRNQSIYDTNIIELDLEITVNVQEAKLIRMSLSKQR